MKDQKSLTSVIGIAIIGTILLIVTNGMTFSGITVFDEAILNEFGWSKSELKFRDLVNLVASSMLMPFIGGLIDRYGVKRFMVLGLTLIGCMYFLYSLIQTTWHMYAIHLVFAIAVSGAGTLATVIMVSQRVTTNRGTAIGIALAGTSAGGIIIPQIGRPLLESYGWRTAFQYEAIIPIIVLLVIVAFVKPVKFNKSVEAIGEKDEETGLTEISFQSAIRQPVFWAICFAGVFCFYSIMGIISNLFLYLRELDFSPKQAANVFSIFFGIILVAKLTSGIIAEYIDEYKLFKIQLALMMLGTAGIALNSSGLVWPSLIAVGLGWGGLYTLLNYIIITTFGVKSAGKIGGVISTFEGIGSGLGAWVTGLVSDKTGNYSMSFWIVVGFLFLALIISFFIKKITPEALAQKSG